MVRGPRGAGGSRPGSAPGYAPPRIESVIATRRRPQPTVSPSRSSWTPVFGSAPQTMQGPEDGARQPGLQVLGPGQDVEGARGIRGEGSRPGPRGTRFGPPRPCAPRASLFLQSRTSGRASENEPVPAEPVGEDWGSRASRSPRGPEHPLLRRPATRRRHGRARSQGQDQDGTTPPRPYVRTRCLGRSRSTASPRS
jgi:hypothetical protein